MRRTEGRLHSRFSALSMLTLLYLFAALQPTFSEPVLLARPTRPAQAKFYPPEDLLDCSGANFSSEWTDFRILVDNYRRDGFPVRWSLYKQAASLVQDKSDMLMSSSLKLPEVLVRQLDVTRLGGFCLYGYATAVFILFRHDYNPEHLETIEKSMGWIEWALDFSESSKWPTLWRHLSLHIEEFQRRGDTSWSREMDYWQEDDQFLPSPTPREVELALARWLTAIGSGRPQHWLRNYQGPSQDLAVSRRLASQLGKREALRFLVLGHHLGSSMEPFSMLQASLAVGTATKVRAKFHGQRHPKVGLTCKEFGYCEENPQLEAWFAHYESRWLGVYEWMPDSWDLALTNLSNIVADTDLRAQGDVVVCGGPAWFCVMLRTLWDVPMLLYFAWPITPLIPEKFKNQVFTQVKLLAKVSEPPAIFVVANWILAAQFALQIQMPVPVQRPHGIYVNHTYSPVAAPDGKQRVMITRVGHWARTSGVALLEQTWAFLEQEKRRGHRLQFEYVFLSIRIRGADSNKAVKYPDFAKFHACVFWPWDVMMLLFDELYSMEMPLLVPEKRWMVHLMKHALHHTEVNWWHVRNPVKGGLPAPSEHPFPLPFDPWIGSSDGIRSIAYWYELTDFAQFPAITYFTSLPDMIRQTESLDIPPIRAKMRAFNKASYRESLAFYRRAALELVSAIPPS